MAGLVFTGATACGRLGYDLLPLAGESGGGTGGTAAKLDAGEGGRSSLPDASLDGSGAGGGGGASTGGAASGGTANGTGGTGGTGGAGGSPSDASAGGATTAPDGATPPDAGCTDPGATLDYCQQIGALPSPPVIDGRLDCGVALRSVGHAGWTDGDASTPDVTAEYAVAWRPDGLYFFVRVHDPNRIPADLGTPAFYGDGVELFVDNDATYDDAPNYDAIGTRRIVAVAPTNGTTPVSRGEIFAPLVSGLPVVWRGDFNAYPTSDGYVVEAFVAAADLGLQTWRLSAGGDVGLNLGIDVSFANAASSGTAGHRLGEFFAHFGNGTAVAPTDDTSAFCKPTLLAP